MDLYKANKYDKYRSYELDNYSKSDSKYRPSTVITSGNTIVTCTDDEWALRAADCKKSPVSKSTDTELTRYKKGEDFCIVAPAFAPANLN